MKWSKELMANNDNRQCETSTGEVYLLDRREKGEKLPSGKEVKRGYAIYKLIADDSSEAYVLAMENDLAPSLYNPPILLTEDQVLNFLNCPENATEFTFNKWLNCYR